MLVTSDFDENQIELNPNSFKTYEELLPQKNFIYNEQIIPNIQQNPYISRSLFINNNYFILPPYLAKRDDILKYYYIYPRIFAYGGVSEVYIAKNNYGKFAIKCISKNGLMNPKEILNEAKISMHLKHKNIVNFYEIYEDISNVYFVMELCENGDLVNLLEQSPTRNLSSDLVIDIMLQIFEVVDYLHNENIIHRDLKPENFLINFDQNQKIIIKLTDFGLSILKPEKGIKLIEIAGTEKIEAPEILKGKGYDEKVDEWALGITMYNLLTGEEVFCVGPQIKNNILYAHINFNKIKDVELRNLNAMLLNRDVSGRISAGEALEILKNIKFKRNNIYKNMDFSLPDQSFLLPNNIFLVNRNENVEGNSIRNFVEFQNNEYSDY